VLLERILVLVQLGHTLIGCDRNVARRWLKRTVKNFHESGFAAAISANQTIAVAIAKFNRNIFEQRFGTKLHGDVCSRNQELGPE
jgi:hypothetical protein